MLGVSTSRGKEVEATTTAVEPKEEGTTQDAEGSTKGPEKRGLYRVTGVLGENPQPYFVYSDQQQASVGPQYEPRAAAASPAPKYETTYVKPYPLAGFSAQPTYQQQFVLPGPGHAYPYSAPIPAPAAPMVLLMMPPHPGSPYGSLMLLPASNIFPQFTPNHILPYHTPAPAPSRYVFPQYVPVPAKPFLPTAHFKNEYPQKPTTQYQGYQDQSASVEEVDQSTTSPNYGSRMRSSEQYVKG